MPSATTREAGSATQLPLALVGWGGAAPPPASALFGVGLAMLSSRCLGYGAVALQTWTTAFPGQTPSPSFRKAGVTRAFPSPVW
jgi:hypothetical protein